MFKKFNMPQTDHNNLVDSNMQPLSVTQPKHILFLGFCPFCPPDLIVPYPGFAENIILICRYPLVDVFPCFLELILTMLFNLSPPRRLRMPPRSLKSSRASPTSLSHHR